MNKTTKNHTTILQHENIIHTTFRYFQSHHAKKMATHKKGPSNTSTLPKSMTRTNTNTLTHYKRSPTSTILSPRNVGHQLNIDKPSPSKISNNHSLYRPMDRSAERRFEEPERYTKRYPEPASRY